MDDKIDKLKSKIDKLSHDFRNNDFESKNRERIKKLKVELENATKHMQKISAQNSFGQDRLGNRDEEDFRLFHPYKSETDQKEQVTREQIDKMIQDLREKRNALSITKTPVIEPTPTPIMEIEELDLATEVVPSSKGDKDK